MKRNLNKNSSNPEISTRVYLTDSIQEEILLPVGTVQKNNDLQQGQAQYLNRLLEAYGDCV